MASKTFFDKEETYVKELKTHIVKSLRYRGKGSRKKQMEENHCMLWNCEACKSLCSTCWDRMFMYLPPAHTTTTASVLIALEPRHLGRCLDHCDGATVHILVLY